MLAYFFIIATLLILMMTGQYFYEEGKDVTSAVFYVGVIELCFFMAFRSYLVGADTKEYYVGFQQLADSSLRNLQSTVLYGFGGNYTLNFEYGYRLFNKLISYISHNPQTIIICTGLMTVGLFAILIKRYSPNPLLSLWLYVTLGLFQTQMNISRNSLAIIITYFGIKYIHNNKFFSFLFFVLIGSLIHSSVLLMIPIYFLVNYSHLNRKKVNVYFVFSLIIGLILGVGRNIVVHFIPSKYAYLSHTANVKLEGLLVGVMYILFFSLIYLTNLKVSNEMIKENQVGTWMFLIAILFYVSGIGLSFATRVAIIFGTFMVIYFPRLAYTHGIDPNKRKILIAIIVLLSGIQYILRLNLNNIGGTIPYTFFWSI